MHMYTADINQLSSLDVAPWILCKINGRTWDIMIAGKMRKGGSRGKKTDKKKRFSELYHSNSQKNFRCGKNWTVGGGRTKIEEIKASSNQRMKNENERAEERVLSAVMSAFLRSGPPFHFSSIDLGSRNLVQIGWRAAWLSARRAGSCNCQGLNPLPFASKANTLATVLKKIKSFLELTNHRTFCTWVEQDLFNDIIWTHSICL